MHMNLKVHKFLSFWVVAIAWGLIVMTIVVGSAAVVGGLLNAIVGNPLWWLGVAGLGFLVATAGGALWRVME